MRKITVLTICIASCLGVFGQQKLGIQNSNYSGIQGALLNPSSIADSKLKFDVNIFSSDVNFANDFLYAPKSSLNFLGFKRIIQGAIDENLFLPRYNNSNPNQLFNVTFQTEILGPSFFMKIKDKHKHEHELGLTIAARASSNVKDIPGNVAINAFDYFLGPPTWNTNFTDNSTRINTMGWLEYGLHYATVLHEDSKSQLKGGISLNYLQGAFAAYVKNTHINYNIADTTSINFANTSVDYGRTDYDDFNGPHPHHTIHGHGVGMDIGFTYVRKLDDVAGHSNGKSQSDPDKINYLYRIGLSLIDIGSIKYNNNSATYHLEATAASFANWHQYVFTANSTVDRTLSSVFYNGDSTKSQTGNSFNMALPAAISLQGDYNFGRNYFANVTIIKGFGHGDNNGVTRPDIYSITPRYEKRDWEVSLPFSVISYGHTQVRLGIAGRYKYFFIGGDAPGALLKLHDLNGVDFYAGVHLYMPEKNTSH